MSDEQFRQMCNVYGFAPSRALREMLDAVAGQAVAAEREACAITGGDAANVGIDVASAIRARGQQ